MRRFVRLAAQSRIAGAGMGFLRVFCLAQKGTSAHEYVIDYMNFTASVSSVKQKDGRQAILHRRDRNDALIVRAEPLLRCLRGRAHSGMVDELDRQFRGLDFIGLRRLGGAANPVFDRVSRRKPLYPQPMWGRPLHRHA